MALDASKLAARRAPDARHARRTTHDARARIITPRFGDSMRVRARRARRMWIFHERPRRGRARDIIDDDDDWREFVRGRDGDAPWGVVERERERFSLERCGRASFAQRRGCVEAWVS